MITVTAASHFIACVLAFFTSMELQKLAEVHGLGFEVFFGCERNSISCILQIVF